MVCFVSFANKVAKNFIRGRSWSCCSVLRLFPMFYALIHGGQGMGHLQVLNDLGSC